MKEIPVNRMNFKLGLLLVLTGMFIMSYVSCKKVFDREILINESILRLAPRNVHRTPGNDKIILSVRDQRNPYIPPESDIIISTKDPKKKLKDVININYDTYGWTFRPGITVGAVGLNSFYFGLDAKFGFINRWGLIGGIGYRTDYPYRGISPDIGISYRIDKGIFHNTELCGKYILLPNKAGFLGVRINL